MTGLPKNAIATAEVGQRMAAQARERAVEAHGSFVESGPICDVLIARGFSAERVRSVISAFTETLRPEMLGVVGPVVLNNLALDLEAAVESLGGEIAYQVRVFTGDHDALKAGVPLLEHLVDVRASDPVTAELVASQIAARREGVPMSSEVVTDATLTVF